MPLKRVLPSILITFFLAALGLAASPSFYFGTLAESIPGSSQMEETTEVLRVSAGRDSTSRTRRLALKEFSAPMLVKRKAHPPTAHRRGVAQSLRVRSSNTGLGFPLLS